MKGRCRPEKLADLQRSPNFPGPFAGHGQNLGSGQVFEIMRVGSVRVGSGGLGRVGSGRVTHIRPDPTRPDPTREVWPKP